MPPRICLIPCSRPGNGADLSARLAEGGAHVLRPESFPVRPYPLSLPPELQLCLRVHDYLRTVYASFDTVIFPSLGAFAFYPLQARASLGEGEGLRYVVALDGTTQKTLEDTGAWNSQGLHGTKLMWCERYAVEHCDALLMQDEATLAWVLDKGWKLPPIITFEEITAPAQAAPPVQMELTNRTPRISVCVAHYNHGPYLHAALQSLAEQDYPNIEVVVCDDGSTDAASRDAFDRCAAMFDSRFQFFKHPNSANQGPSHSRNACVERATGEYCIFFDADNLALPEMVRVFFSALERSGADVVVSHYKAFREGTDIRTLKTAYLCAPTGPDLASCVFGNTIGDVVCLLRKELFTRIGGFAPTRHGCEDWELLVRLTLAGYRQEVIPEALYWYRHTETGMRGTMDVCHSHRLVLETYARHLPGFAAEAFAHLAVPQFHGAVIPNEVIVRAMIRLGYTMETYYQRLFPVGSLRQRALSFFWNSVASRTRKGSSDA